MSSWNNRNTMRCPAHAVLPMSNRVNHVGNDDEECSCPMEITKTEHRLFARGASLLVNVADQT
jgi:hypothetical protein